MNPFYNGRAATARKKAQELGGRLTIRDREINERHEIMPELLAQLWEEGYYCYLIPKELGGEGGSIFEAALILEELAPKSSSVSLSLLIQSLGVLLISEDSDGDRKERRLSRVANERKFLAFALSESLDQETETRAESEQGGYRLKGRKVYVNQGREADWVLAMADTEKGLSIFLVEKGSAGMSATRDFPRAAAPGLSWAEIIFDQVTVPKDGLVGEPGAGERICQNVFCKTAPLVSAMALGLTQAAIKGIGPDSGCLQVRQSSDLEYLVARAGVELAAGRALCYESAYGIDKAMPDADRLAIAAKIFATEQAFKFLSRLSERAGAQGVALDQELKANLEFVGLMRSLLASNSFLLLERPFG